MVLRKVLNILTILCLLTLTGTFLTVSAAEDTPHPILVENVEQVSPAGVAFAIGDELENELPESMEVIGRYNVTIDPAENFTVQPINLDDPVEMRRNTPIGALDAVAQTGELNYTAYLQTARNQLILDSVDDYLFQEQQPWLLFHENGSYITTTVNIGEYALSDGETIWFIYCDLTDYDSRFDFPADFADAGLAITVTYGETNVTPTQTGNVTITPTDNVTPMPTQIENVTTTPTDNATPMPTLVEQGGLVEMIGQDDNLSILSSALNATDLVSTLQADGPYTIFAPDNDAFDRLPLETFAEILIDDNELTRVLSNHVVNGSYTAAELLNMTEDGNTTSLLTLTGENLTVSASGGVLMVDNATVVLPEINASNGVVHVIDQVLIPSAGAPVPTPTEPMTPVATIPGIVTPVATPTEPATTMPTIPVMIG